MEKLPRSEYATFSELVRDLVRKWVNDELIEVKRFGTTN